MAMNPEALAAALPVALGDALKDVNIALGEVTAIVPHDRLTGALRTLRDRPELRFDILVDLCGVDYSAYGGGTHDGRRFAVVYHLLSLANNHRVRVRCFAPDDGFPVVPSAVEVWPNANWFEREAFDLYGVRFQGHPDLRRILMYPEFVGHPLRKDYPKEKRQPLVRRNAGTRE